MQELTDRLSVNIDYSVFDVQGPLAYNSIFSQILNITVPQNLNLHAGNTIVVNIAKSSGCQFEYDEKLSGKYLIKSLPPCHELKILFPFIDSSRYTKGLNNHKVPWKNLSRIISKRIRKS